MTMTHLECQIDIGTLTTLSDAEWRRQFIATFDEDGSMTHESMVFIKNNRYPNDCEDATLEEYAEWCFLNNIEF
nr:hypothetical protein [uncultured Pseudomonas sp.]